jgi:hypothetical protein
MACNLDKDALGLFDALGKIGQTPTVFVKSDASLVARAVAATLNGVNVPVDPNGRMKLPALVANNNVLELVLVGIDVDIDIHLVEDCGDSNTVDLKTKFVGRGPGGANPNIGFRIHAS